MDMVGRRGCAVASRHSHPPSSNQRQSLALTVAVISLGHRAVSGWYSGLRPKAFRQKQAFKCYSDQPAKRSSSTQITTFHLSHILIFRKIKSKSTVQRKNPYCCPRSKVELLLLQVFSFYSFTFPRPYTEFKVLGESVQPFMFCANV